ncbi:phosphate-starvation-inducible PsiE family protein [Sulfobacillus thermosulfidooxidans]|uniref:phosphate-starvation-inducible PsiE family protein n=1 Tax=Sulfobacillus thermosulfidooxidans TaxID=28034 RepID=UPI0002E85FC3|nr:phosphate-starvation-inducible PsiE family protein [Sulfobacillus thermosulfidooxidans]
MVLSEATPLHSGSPIRPLVLRMLLWGIDMLYLLAVFSVLWLAIHVISTLAQRLMAPSPYGVLLTVLDPILLMMMLAELLHTIVVAFGTHRLPRQQLLALLWMALLRHAVVMTQTASSIATPNAAATNIGWPYRSEYVF